MDVKITSDSAVNELYGASNFDFTYNATGFVDKAEEFLKNSGLPYDEEQMQQMRSFIEEVNKIMESNKAASEKVKEEIMAMKKKIIENMIKTVRMLNSKLYTKDSWKKSMGEVEKAVKIFKNKDITSGQLNTALRHLRNAMSKLQPAKKKDIKGKEYEREKALSRTNKLDNGDEDKYNLGSVLETSQAAAGIIDISIGAECDVATVSAESGSVSEAV